MAPFVGLLKLVVYTGVEIRGTTRRCPVLIGSGLIEQVGKRVRNSLRANTCAIVTDTNVAPLFGRRVKR